MLVVDPIARLRPFRPCQSFARLAEVAEANLRQEANPVWTCLFESTEEGPLGFGENRGPQFIDITRPGRFLAAGQLGLQGKSNDCKDGEGDDNEADGAERAGAALGGELLAELLALRGSPQADALRHVHGKLLALHKLEHFDRAAGGFAVVLTPVLVLGIANLPSVEGCK